MRYMEDDIHSAHRNFESLRREIQAAKIPESNRRVLIDFADSSLANGRSICTVLNQMGVWFRLAQWLGKDFTSATMDDIHALVARVESSVLKPSTKNLYKALLKQLYKHIEGSDEEYPLKVRWIKVRFPVKRVRPQDVLSQEDVRKLLEVCSDIQDKAFIAVLYESGGRIGEILPLRIGDAVLNNVGYDISVFGKTGGRVIPVIDSAPYLATWLENHPQRNDSTAPLWVNTGTRNHGARLGFMTCRHRIHKWGEKAGVTKRLNHHSFRHARATHLAPDVREPVMRELFGWSPGSKMPAVYVHMSGATVKRAILRLHGLEDDSAAPDNQLARRNCPRCQALNEATGKICKKCLMPLDSEIATRVMAKENAVASLLDMEMIERMIAKRVEEKLRERAGVLAQG